MKLRYLILALLCSPALAQNFGYNGQCAKGGQGVITQGLLSSGTQPLLSGNPNVGSGVIASYPSCIVTVFLTGSGTLATLASNKTGTPLTNPFTANTDGSYLLFSVAGEYDISMSGAGLPSTVTLTDIQLGATGGGGGSSISLQTSGVTNTNQNLLNLAVGSGLSVVNSLGTTTFTNTGILSITTDTGLVTGAFTNAATDYGTKGIHQNGIGTLSIQKNSQGTLALGDSIGFNNYIAIFPDSSPVGIVISDVNNNDLALQNAPSGGQPGSGPSLIVSAGAGAKFELNTTDIAGTIPGIISPTTHVAFDITSTQALFNVPINIAGSLTATGNSQVVNLTVTGSCTGCATGSVATVSGTSNQIINTGTSSNPVIALYGGAGLGGSTPLIFPGNIASIQFANGDAVYQMTRKTDTTPTGLFLAGRAAGGSVLFQIDINGNGLFNSLATSNASTAGYFGFEQGPDAFAACTAAAGAANVICEYSPTAITTYGKILDGTGPASANGSVSVWSNLASSITQEAFMGLSGSTAVSVACGTASLAGAANGIIIVGDGNGCEKSSGVNVSGFLPSIQGPASPYTNATTSGTTVFTYSSAIQGGTVVNIDCAGSYTFTTAAEQAEFGINFTNTPTNMALNVEIGFNATTGTHSYNRQTVNGSLLTATSAAAATGTHYPVWIHGGVLTNLSSTFTIQGATSNAAGTLNVDQNGFVCSVK